MSKSSKKNGKRDKKNKSKKADKAKAKADATAQMIALDGTRGAKLEEATVALARQYGRGEDGAGWSRWDASNTFYELRLS